MSRPVGVTASAIVAFLGSIIALLFAVLMAATPFMATPQPQPPYAAQVAIASAATGIALAILGIWTSIGLWRLRPWARTSILVFAGFVAVGCLFSLLITMAIPKSPAYSVDTEHVIRATMTAMFGIPLAIAVWWLIQFNTPSTKAAFLAPPAAEAASSRPLSIMIIAWTSIIGGAFCLFPLLARMPAFLFGFAFNGWIAGIIYAAFGALSLYIGKGLLDLRERARVLAIAWFAFSIVHAGAVTLVPSLRQRMIESQQALMGNQPNPIPFDQGMMLKMGFVFAAIVAGACIWFLIRNRPAFVRAETA